MSTVPPVADQPKPLVPIGVLNPDFLELLAYQAKKGSDYRNIYGDKDNEPIDKNQPSQAVADALLGAFQSIEPQDAIETMLVGQMTTVHNAAMQAFMRAAATDSHNGRDMALNRANKLCRTFTTLAETLSRHRGKGQQKVVVEHVYVYPGGQAIVGNVTPQGREGGGKK